MLTYDVLSVVKSRNGVKCREIVDTLQVSQNVVSGVLSSLKLRKRIYNHLTLWYEGDENIMTSVFSRIRDAHGSSSIDTKWSEGFLSALADYGIITERQFEKLREALKS